MSGAATVRLCYDPLQQLEVQLANYGRELEWTADAIAGF